jgi:hypothetical protein
MVTAILTLLILITVGLVIIQLREGKNVNDNLKPVVQDELLEIPVDDVKIERAKVIVDKLEDDDTNSESIDKTIETAKKIIMQVETKNTAIIAKTVKVQATVKKESSQTKVLETQKKLKELDIKAAQSIQKIKSKRDTVSKINTALEEVVVRSQKEIEEQEEKARLLEEEMAEKKRQAELRILAAKDKAEQAKKEKEERAAAFRAKMAKYAEDKAAAEAEVIEKEKKAKQARALEIALAKKALQDEAAAEMKRVLEEQRMLQEELKEKELVELQEAEEARQIQLEENRVQMEEAKLKREEQEAEAAEAAEALAEKMQIEKEEAEELRLAEEERLAEIEIERLAAEEEAAAVLEEERQRQEEMDKEVEELRLEQEDELRELEEERAAEAAEVQQDYELERQEYDRLKKELAVEEAEYLEDAKEEARLSQISHDADIAANAQEQSAALEQNLSESEAAADRLVERVDNIQESANVAAETATSLSESGTPQSTGTATAVEPLKFFCLSPDPVPKLDDNGNATGEYYAYGDDMRDENQPTTIPEERCERKCGVFDGNGNKVGGRAAEGFSETCEDICTTHYVPNPGYVPPSDWDGIMDKEKCDSIDGFNWTSSGQTSSLCLHDASDTSFAKVTNCVTAGGYSHHGSYTDDKILATMSNIDRWTRLRAAAQAKRQEQHLANKKRTLQAIKQNEDRIAAHRERMEKKREAYLESLRHDCEYQYSKTVKTGLKSYIEAIKKSATTLHPKGTPRGRTDAQKLLGYDPSAQECRPCDPFTKEYLHIIKEPSDPGKKSCPTENPRKTPCTPVISCSEYTQKMNATTRARHEALLTLETKNKSELRDLLVFARAESKARGSYERQVKRIDTVVTESQKTRYDAAVAEKKKAWDDAKVKYNEEGQKLFNAYYDEVNGIRKQLQYCKIRTLATDIDIVTKSREDSLNKKYFGNDLPYDYDVRGEGAYIAPDKFAILASTLPLKNLPNCGGSRFSGSIKVANGPGYLSPPSGSTSVASSSSSAKIKDSYFGSCEATAKHGHGSVYKSSGGNFVAVHDSNNGTTYILEKRRASRYSNGRVEHAKQQGSFSIEAGGKLVLLHAKKARDEVHVKDQNGNPMYAKKTTRTYDSCMRRVGRNQVCSGGYKYSRVNDTTKPIKSYTYHTRQSQRTELYNFNDTSKGYTLIANFATKDFWLVSTDGRYYSVANDRVQRLDSSLKCKITKPVISNAIGGFKGMKKHIAQCFEQGATAGCSDVYSKRALLDRTMRQYTSLGYPGRSLYD